MLSQVRNRIQIVLRPFLAGTISIAITLSILTLGQARAGETQQQPIHFVYVNHVEVESVIEHTPPALDGVTYTASSSRYLATSASVEWEMAQAEAVGALISFHMSGAYAELAVANGAPSTWAGHMATGHVVGVHTHGFLRGPFPFEWTNSTSPSQSEIEQHWQDHRDLVAMLVGGGNLWVGESHYSCPPCWQAQGYQLATTEAMALLPASQHIIWLVQRSPIGTITYPHFPQIGTVGYHGPEQIYFDLRLPQLKKELLMLVLEWLERERLPLPPQIWAWGWLNHGGSSTVQNAEAIQAMLAFMATFAGRTSARGNVIARFVNDHELSDIFQAYEDGGGQPLPSPTDEINDQFPYLAYALEDAGVVEDLTLGLGLPGIRLFELVRDSAELPPASDAPLYLLFRETDGSDGIDLRGILSSRGITSDTLTLIDIEDGGRSRVDAGALILGPKPLVLDTMPAGVFSDGFESGDVSAW